MSLLRRFFFWPLCKACWGSGGGSAGNFSFLRCWVGVPGAGPVWMVFWGMLGLSGPKMASRRLEGQIDRFAAFFGPPEALLFSRLCRARLGQGWGRGGTSNLPSLRCWVGVPGAGRIWRGFWGMLGLCGLKLGLKRLEGQNYRFTAFFGPMEGAFLLGPCERACWGRGGAGSAQVTFPPSGAGLGPLVRGLFGCFFGVCWGFVGKNWHQHV